MSPAWAQVFVGLLQCGLIGWGLWLMQRASNDRNKQLDQHGTVLEQHGRALEQQGRALESIGLGIQELLRRTA